MTEHDQAIDWHRDDGVSINMITNHARNQFYNHVLASSVSGQHCVDVGFGTGLLTMMALQHGARSVTAYEVDPVRYRFGQHLIQQLGLADRVQLLNQRYAPADDGQLVFHEVLGNNLWDESAWSFVRHSQNILPAQYSTQLWIASIDSAEYDQLLDTAWSEHNQARFCTWYQSVKDSSWPHCDHPDDFKNLSTLIQAECEQCFGWNISQDMLDYQFDPGVSVDPAYQQLIQQSINSAEYVRNNTSLLPACWPAVGARSLYTQLLGHAQLAVEWTLNAQTQQLVVESDTTVVHPWPDSEVQILLGQQHFKNHAQIGIVRHLLQHRDHKIYLSESSWAPAWHGLVIFDHVRQPVTLTQNLNTGHIRYTV
jgi:hypothetical protein